MSAPQQQRERTFAEVWCDSLEDLRKASTTKSGAERVIGKDEVVMRVACVLRLSMLAVRERAHTEADNIEAEIAARLAGEIRRAWEADAPERVHDFTGPDSPVLPRADEPMIRGGMRRGGDMDTAYHLLIEGLVWDGNLASKRVRNHFVANGYALRAEGGLNTLTGRGVFQLLKDPEARMRVAERELRELLTKLCPGSQRTVTQAFREVERLKEEMSSCDQEASE